MKLLPFLLILSAALWPKLAQAQQPSPQNGSTKPGSTAQAPGASANGGTAVDQASQEAAALPTVVTADDARLFYSGRFDLRDAKAPRCAWPASAVTLRFRGTAANVCMTGKRDVRWQVYVDGKPAQVLINNGNAQVLNLVKDAADGEHTATLLKRTEAFFGPVQIAGFQLNKGAEVLRAEPPARLIEVVGDSISAGYGNEASNQHEKFSAVTENAGIAYGALTARALNADYTCIAWSGKKLWPNNAIPDLYDRIIPQENGSTWEFPGRKPNAVVINLGTNDFAPGNPEEEGWIAAYKTFIGRIRTHYPDAFIFCAVSPMISDPYSKSKNARTTILGYIGRVVNECQKAGDAKVAMVEFPAQTGALGFGADWHPSARQHEAMAAVLEKAIKEKLGW